MHFSKGHRTKHCQLEQRRSISRGHSLLFLSKCFRIPTLRILTPQARRPLVYESQALQEQSIARPTAIGGTEASVESAAIRFVDFDKLRLLCINNIRLQKQNLSRDLTN